MKKYPIKISVDFQDSETFIVFNKMVCDFETAIKIVRLLKIQNVRLTQERNGNVMEWDNF